MPGEESVVVLVVPNPEPGNPFALENADGSVFARDADRVHRARLTHPLELETRVSGVEHEGSVGYAGLVLNLRRELAEQVPKPGVGLLLYILSGSMGVVRPAAESAAASSANAFRASCDWANRRVHPSSHSSSDCSHPAMRSCSSGGRDESWEKTLWSARVMGEAYRPGDCRTSRCSRQSRRRDIGVELRGRLGGGLAP